MCFQSAINLITNLLLITLMMIGIELVMTIDSQIIPNIAKSLDSTSQSHNNLLEKCHVCSLLVQSFKHGLERTSRGKYEGGDTNWEEKNKAIYADSEVRLVEIEEKLCQELSTGKDQCHSMAEESESYLEHWWFKERHQVELYQYLCISQAKVCCPENHVGTNCEPCPGHPDNICNHRGYCEGNGTRSGSGKCVCDSQFGGTSCERCGKGYFQTSKDSTQELTCEKCDDSCAGRCRGLGARNCVACKNGYIWDKDLGCFDIDECAVSSEQSSPCKGNTFCINTEGSYYCYNCDKACLGCDGDGPDNCLRCAPNHEMKDGVCVDSQVRKRQLNESLARYATYLGLCVATCIILRKNLIVASIIGASVAIYISLSELSLKEESGSYSLGKLFM